jgi:hypothetical protein
MNHGLGIDDESGVSLANLAQEVFQIAWQAA